MRNFIIVGILSIFWFNTFSQVAVFKKFFFDLPYHAEKFEIRTAVMANDIFSDIKDNSGSISADFSYHPYISNLSKTKSKPYLYIQFNDQGISEIKRLVVYYGSDQVNDCLNKYNEIISLFKPYTKKSEPKSSYDSNTGEKVGKGLMIYPTIGAKFFLIDVEYSYNDIRQTYELEVLMFEDNMWK